GIPAPHVEAHARVGHLSPEAAVVRVVVVHRLPMPVISPSVSGAKMPGASPVFDGPRTVGGRGVRGRALIGNGSSCAPNLSPRKGPHRRPPSLPRPRHGGARPELG